MKYRVKVRWVDLGSEPAPEASPVFFNWKTWKWVRDPSAAVPLSCFEWPEFWAGVIDVLLADKNDSDGRGMPPGAYVLWERNDAFVRIGVARAPLGLPENLPPPWFSRP